MKISLVALLALWGSLFAQEMPYGVVFPLQWEAESGVGRPDLATYAGGNFLACWESWGEDWDGRFNQGIHAQLLSPEGRKIRAGLVIDPHADYDEEMPLLLSLADGTMLLAWTSTRHDIGRRAWAQLLSDRGEFIGMAFPASPSSNFQEYLISAAQLAGGRIVFCLQISAEAESAWDLQAQVFMPNGEKVGDPVQVNTYTDSDQIWPQIIPLTGGGFFIYWMSHGQDGAGFGIYGQRFDSSGGKIGDEFQINPIAAGEQIPFDEFARLKDGSFFICYEERNDTTGVTGFYLRRFNGEGVMTGEALPVTSPAVSLRYTSSVAVCADQSFAVTWIVYNNQGGFERHGQLFSPEGNRKGESFRIEQISYVSSGFGPAVIPAAQDGFLVIWDGIIGDSWETRLYGQSFDAEGRKTGPEFEISGEVIDNTARFFYASGHREDQLFAWMTPLGREIHALRFPDAPLRHTLAPFRLLYPRPDSLLKVIEPTLVWQQPGDFTVCHPREIHYRVFVDDSADFSSPITQEVYKDTACIAILLQTGKSYFWKVLAQNIAGESLWSSNIGTFSILPGTGVPKEDAAVLPPRIVLHPNFPNPFNLETQIRFDLAEAGWVQLAVYDMLGRRITSLLDAKRLAGSHTVRWDGRDGLGVPCSSGIYICRIEVQSPGRGMYTRSIKICVVK